MKVTLFRLLSLKTNLIRNVADFFGVYLIAAGKCVHSEFFNLLTNFICNELAPIICKNGLRLFDPDPSVDNTQRIPEILDHFPAGTSVNTIAHYGQFIQQNMTRPVFRKFDYGKAANQIYYKQSTPPVYDLGKIKIPVVMFIGLNDPLGNIVDNTILYNDLVGLGVDVRKYEINFWGHLTFLWMKDPSPEYGDLVKEINSD